MFHLEVLRNGEWEPMNLPDYKSSENAKNALKTEYQHGRLLPLPEPGNVRIVGGNDNQVYYIFEGMNKGFRFKWRTN